MGTPGRLLRHENAATLSVGASVSNGPIAQPPPTRCPLIPAAPIRLGTDGPKANPDIRVGPPWVEHLCGAPRRPSLRAYFHDARYDAGRQAGGVGLGLVLRHCVMPDNSALVGPQRCSRNSGAPPEVPVLSGVKYPENGWFFEAGYGRKCSHGPDQV